MQDLMAMLVTALYRQLVPNVKACGFKGPRVDLGEPDADTPPRASIHLDFSRLLPPSTRHVLTIKALAGHQLLFERPSFVVYAGTVPAEGVLVYCPEEVIPPERVTTDMLDEIGFLQASPVRGYSPFQMPLISYWLGRSQSIERMVTSAEESLPHLIAWLEDGTLSSIVRVERGLRPVPEVRSRP